MPQAKYSLTTIQKRIQIEFAHSVDHAADDKRPTSFRESSHLWMKLEWLHTVSLGRGAGRCDSVAMLVGKNRPAGEAQYPMQPEERIEYFKDGSVRARGWMLDGLLSGYWEWFRKDGVRMRSGHFERGVQVGEWITYDQHGAVYKKTTMKPTKT